MTVTPLPMLEVKERPEVRLPLTEERKEITNKKPQSLSNMEIKLHSKITQQINAA